SPLVELERQQRERLDEIMGASTAALAEQVKGISGLGLESVGQTLAQQMVESMSPFVELQRQQRELLDHLFAAADLGVRFDPASIPGGEFAIGDETEALLPVGDVSAEAQLFVIALVVVT